MSCNEAIVSPICEGSAMPLSRFRIRTLMIAVAVVACAIQAGRTWEHWRYCVGRARYHATLAGVYHRMREVERARMAPSHFQALETVLNRLEAENLASQRKWEYAARRPFLPVPPDAPEPK